MQRFAIFARTSVDRNQTVENQLLQLKEVATRLSGAVHAMPFAGTDIRKTARRTGAGTASVMRIKQTLEAHA